MILGRCSILFLREYFDLRFAFKASAMTESYSFSPIGFFRGGEDLKFGVPHQPRSTHQAKNRIELLPGKNFEAALRDLGGFDRIWLIWCFHLNSSWRPCVLPPRGESKRRGLFATRSPHRPNPIAISCVNLLEIKGRDLYVGDTDLVNGSPIFDIKPYIKEVDSFPTASSGWLEEVSKRYEMPATFQVELSELALQQFEWLKSTWQVDFFSYAKQLLERDPSPHRTRRIIRLDNDSYRMGCGAWRIFFTLNDRQVRISKFEPGYPPHALNNPKMDRISDKEAQIGFTQKWPVGA